MAIEIALVGLGRIGMIHAFHAMELERETGSCRVTALVDSDLERARGAAAELSCSAPVFDSVEALVAAGGFPAAVVSTPTDLHRAHAMTLVAAGKRVLLEKPLTGSLAESRAFAAELDGSHPDAVMLAFQRRFDPAARYMRELMTAGTIGRVFKIYSSLEDSAPPPDDYRSGGILTDMGVHNVDEILWLTGRMPRSAVSLGARLHGHKLSKYVEDFDDALLYLWFEGELAGQVQVSRHHVSGYRVETVILGEEGQIHMGRFEQRPFEVMVEAYGKRGRTEPLARRVFPLRRYAREFPEFIERFGDAYKAELAAFLDCCASGARFEVTHVDGIRAQEVLAAGMSAVMTAESGRQIG